MKFVETTLLLLSIGAAFSAPNPQKVLESNEIPSVSIGAGGVSASWGGYSAKAGLGGNTGLGGGLFASADSPHGKAAAGLGGTVGDSVAGGLGASASSPYGGTASAGLGGDVGVGGGLFASAGSPNGNAAAGLGGKIGDNLSGGLGASASSPYGGSAGAGLGGSSVSSHASAGGFGSIGGSSGGSYASSGASAGITGGHTQVVYNGNNKPGLFDNIFNIPISVLQAVNGLLNQQQGAHVTKTVRLHGHRHQQPVIDNRSSFSQSESSANAGSATVYEQHSAELHPLPSPHGGAKGSAGGAVLVQKRPVNFDNIFNIPISVIRAVNKLLNEGAESITKSFQVQQSTKEPNEKGSAHAIHTGSAQINHKNAGSSLVAQPLGSIGATAAVEGQIHISKGTQGSSSLVQPQALVADKPAGFYDNVFNIPITALKSVNQLLNG